MAPVSTTPAIVNSNNRGGFMGDMVAALGSNRRAAAARYTTSGGQDGALGGEDSMVGDRVCVCDRTGRFHTVGDRLARGATGPPVPSRYRRGAPEPASRRLADVAPDAEQLGLKPAPGHHREQRPLSADG